MILQKCGSIKDKLFSECCYTILERHCDERSNLHPSEAIINLVNISYITYQLDCFVVPPYNDVLR